MNVDRLDLHKVKSLYWDKELNIAEIAKTLDIPYWSLYGFMNKNNIARRLPSDANYVVNKFKPRFKIKEKLNIYEENLKTAGLMLYWAEGTLLHSTVAFSNSNPEMVKIFLKFLREICGINEERLRVYVYAYSYQDINKIKQYWHNLTRIPLSQFTRPYIKKNNLNLSRRKLPYGFVQIRYNDKRLLLSIKNWIDEYVIWAGTQAAKGDRLSKGSVLSKGRMEK